MESDEGTRFSGGESFLHGAIFMCNRKTKRECIQRKLFGLPPSMKEIVRSIRPGATLFLFEYEERKMYGVFEATSCGDLNIVPNAFRSSGKSFSAQVYFKELWNCQPLLEDEFRAAIIGNYYSPRKFNLALSRGQVGSLLKLFTTRIIRISNRLCSAPSCAAEEDFKNSRSKPMKLHKLIGQQQYLDRESLYPTTADTSYREQTLDSEDYFSRNDVLSHPNLQYIDNLPDIDGLYSEDPVYLPPQGNVPLMGHRVLPNSRHSQSLQTVGGFHDGLPNVPRNVGPLSQDELYKSQIDAGTTDSVGYLPIDSYDSLEAYKGRTIQNQGLTDRLISSSIHSNAEALRNDRQRYVFDLYMLPASNSQQELGNNADLQKVGINPANIISGAYDYPCQLLTSDDGSSQLQSQDPGTLNFPETESGRDILLSCPSQMNKWDEGHYMAEHEDCYEDINRKIACQRPPHHKRHANHCRKDRQRQKKCSVFSRISNAPIVDDQQDLDERTSAEQVQIHLSKLNPRGKSPCAESSFAAVGKKKFGTAPACEKKCGDVSSYVRQRRIAPVQEQMHRTIKVEPSQEDSSTKIDRLPGDGNAVEAFSVREFINFKRRSLVRKDGSSAADVPLDVVGGESSKSSSLGKVKKRRKLVRPTFSNGFVEDTSFGQNECRNGQEELQDSSMLGGEASVKIANPPMGDCTAQDDAKEYVVGVGMAEDITGQGEVNAEVANRSLSIGHHFREDGAKADVACKSIHKDDIRTFAAQISLQEVPQEDNVDHEVSGAESFFQFKHARSKKQVSHHQPRSLWENPEHPREMYSAVASCSVSENNASSMIKEPEENDALHRNIPVAMADYDDHINAKLKTDEVLENAQGSSMEHDDGAIVRLVLENAADIGVGGKNPRDYCSQECCSIGSRHCLSVPSVENNIVGGTSEDFIALSDVPFSTQVPMDEDGAGRNISIAVALRDTASAKR